MGKNLFFDMGIVCSTDGALYWLFVTFYCALAKKSGTLCDLGVIPIHFTSEKMEAKTSG